MIRVAALVLLISDIDYGLSAAPRPNIVLIAAEELGHECLGVNGGPYKNSKSQISQGF